MTEHALQFLDAGFLVGIVLSLIVIMQRDYQDAPIFMRAALAGFGVLASGQAAWLLGIWAPESAGFPWPRAAMDGSMLVIAALRVFFPLTVSVHIPPRVTRHDGETAF